MKRGAGTVVDAKGMSLFTFFFPFLHNFVQVSVFQGTESCDVSWLTYISIGLFHQEKIQCGESFISKQNKNIGVC